MARILAAEDSAVLFRILNRALSRAGFEVEMAEDGQAAYEKFMNGSFDLVLTDIEMPHLSGRELAEKIWEKNPEQKILFMTGNPALIKDVDPKYKIFKPFDFDDLMARINQYLQRE